MLFHLLIDRSINQSEKHTPTPKLEKKTPSPAVCQVSLRFAQILPLLQLFHLFTLQFFHYFFLFPFRFPFFLLVMFTPPPPQLSSADIPPGWFIFQYIHPCRYTEVSAPSSVSGSNLSSVLNHNWYPYWIESKKWIKSIFFPKSHVKYIFSFKSCKNRYRYPQSLRRSQSWSRKK